MSDTPLTILFADVCQSTQLFERYGDETAHRIINRVLSMLGQVAERHSGTVIKTIGDEVMCTLPGAAHGLEAAIDMQRVISGDIELARERIAIRVGLHHGPTLERDGDVYGDAVNIAARMAGLAKREQIVTTRATSNLLPSNSTIETRELGRTRVRGKLLPMEIVDVLWQEDTSNITVISRAIQVEVPQSTRRMVIRLGDVEVSLKPSSPPVTLGRDPNSNLVIDAAWVSRNHATIEHRMGNFVLTDRSTNGTYVKTYDGDEVHIHRDEFQLRHSGQISPGKGFDSAPDDALVSYEDCERETPVPGS